MPRGTNLYDKSCIRCEKNYQAKMGSQKYCNECSRKITRLRDRGLRGDWTRAKEEQVIKKRGWD